MHVDLAQLFARRKAELERERRGSGSTRAMAERAKAAGHDISHSALGAYARGAVAALPNEKKRAAIAAALGVNVHEVTLAAVESVAPDVLAALDGMQLQHAQAFASRVEGRTDAEIQLTLGVVDATLRAMAGSREAVETSGNGTEVPDGS